MLCFSGAGKPEDALLDDKQHSSIEPAALTYSAPKQPSSSATANVLDVPAPVDSSEALKAVSSAYPTGAAS